MLVLRLELFLQISKEFDKICHAGLLDKLQAYGDVGNILNIIISFL